MHRLLKRQLRKLKLDPDSGLPAAELAQLLERVSVTYQQNEHDCYLLEQSLSVSSEEMQQVYEELRASTEIRLALEKKQAEATLHAEKERAQVTLQAIGEAVVATDADGIIEFINTQAEMLTGWSARESVGKKISLVFRTANHSGEGPYADPVHRAIHHGSIASIPQNTLLVTRSFEERPIKGTAAPIYDQQATVIGCVLVFGDITEEQRLKDTLAHQANHDMLTGLPNRYQFEKHLHSLLQSALQEGRKHVLLYADLDQFKVINDTCGHTVGDYLLKQFSEFLQTCIRAHDTVARLGGDEFGILLENCELDAARRFAAGLLDNIHSFRFQWDDKLFTIGASIGLAPITADCEDAQSALTAADVACYAAKDKGRNRVHVAETTSGVMEQQGEMEWVPRIRQGLDENRFLLFSQPIVPVGESDEGEHFEILLRLREASGELVPPGAFIPSAERYNLMPELDRWVIRNTIRTLQATPRLLIGLDMCSINLSATSLSDENMLGFILAEIESNDFPADRLCFEITETAAISDLAGTLRLIEALKELGCRFALDDFGSGLSSFTYLKNLPVDYLKIDGYFVKDICNDAIDRSMVTAINQIGHTMGIRTIAEFVENDDILARLAKIGVDYAQGYGVGPPLPLTEINAAPVRALPVGAVS